MSRVPPQVEDEFVALIEQVRGRLAQSREERAALAADLVRAQTALAVALDARVEVGHAVAQLVEAVRRHGIEVGDLPVWLRSWGDTIDDRDLLLRVRAEELRR